MLETLTSFPFGFWVVAFLLIGGAIWARTRMRDGSGLPILAVLATVAFWYVGDAIYNDYASNYTKVFGPGTLQKAWWEVASFVVVFLVSAHFLHRFCNARFISRGSGVQKLLTYGINQPMFQARVEQLFHGCLWIWGGLVLVAFIRLGPEIPYFFFPFLAYKAEPWGRARIGAGFDALLTVAFYLQLLVTAMFGVVAALSLRRRTLLLGLTCCLLSWPYFIFDRTRNTLLAVVMPAILSFAFLRLRGGWLKKLTTLVICFGLINAWMAFVIANRSTSSIVAAIKQKGFSFAKEQGAKHEGLNMFEELCWSTTFIEQGTYNPSWGGRYFAELVNPIPRSLWPGKPLIGIDYAIARGQAASGDQGQAGVWATISTGLIGQGVVNFGLLLGPPFAGLLMGLWVAVLGRLDLLAEQVGRLPLYGLGLILTFNLGRDITFITLYPFVFGSFAVWLLDRQSQRHVGNVPRSSQRNYSSTRTPSFWGHRFSKRASFLIPLGRHSERPSRSSVVAHFAEVKRPAWNSRKMAPRRLKIAKTHRSNKT